MQTIEDATKGLDDAAAAAKRRELLAARKAELAEQRQQRAAVEQELDPLLPGQKRVAFVWLYENLTVQPAGRAGGH